MSGSARAQLSKRAKHRQGKRQWQRQSARNVITFTRHPTPVWGPRKHWIQRHLKVVSPSRHSSSSFVVKDSGSRNLEPRFYPEKSKVGEAANLWRGNLFPPRQGNTVTAAHACLSVAVPTRYIGAVCASSRSSLNQAQWPVGAGSETQATFRH